MRKILIAGAGHGGLAAGAALARDGYDVTVVEKKGEGTLGYDWEDRFDFGLLSEITGMPVESFPEGSWRYRGDCVFISPSKRKRIEIKFDGAHRQRVMERKTLIELLIRNAEKHGVKFIYGCEITGPLCEGRKVTGLRTSRGDMPADLVIDAAGVFSPVRTGLPVSCGIEKAPRAGELFYVRRAYFERLPGDEPEFPFEVSMYHEGERGLSWFCTGPGFCDILLGRTEPLSEERAAELAEGYRAEHPWCGKELLRGWSGAVIPVRRPLYLTVADGYAAVGDSAFMTMPMNGMGIDLSLKAGLLLARTVADIGAAPFTVQNLWHYNREFNRELAPVPVRNAGLKDALLGMPASGVDALFESGVIAASDLSGGGGNMTPAALMAKLRGGAKCPASFSGVLKGLMKGASNARIYAGSPDSFGPLETGKIFYQIK